MLEPNVIILIKNIFYYKFIRQEKVNSYIEYLNILKEHLKIKYSLNEIKKIEDFIKSFVYSFEQIEKIKNIDKENVKQIISGELFDFATFETYITNLNKKQTIGLLNKILEKIEFNLDNLHDLDLANFNVFFNKFIDISLKFNCFEDICKGKEKLKSFLKENSNGKIVNKKRNHLDEFYKAKFDFFLSGNREQHHTPIYIINNFLSKTKSTDFISIKDFLNLLNNDEIFFFLKKITSNGDLPFPKEILEKSINLLNSFDKKVTIRDSLNKLSGFKYDMEKDVSSRITNLYFFKEEYKKKDIDFLGKFPEIFYQLGFLSKNEKKDIIKNFPQSEFKNVYYSLGDFLEDNNLEKIKQKHSISKIKLGF